jgi:beta-glucanase (GH16 family)
MTIFRKTTGTNQLNTVGLSLLLLMSFGQGCNKPSTKSNGSPNSSDTIPVVSANPDTSGYILTWSDEFNYTGPPDSSKWTYDLGNGSNGWGNQELEYYTNSPGNVWVDSGRLTIQANKDYLNGFQYTSARLLTRGKAQWKYGKIVIRAKLPSGRGTWPAIWMLGAEQPLIWPDDGEIDIMEEVGFQPNMIHGTIHTSSTEGGTGASGMLEVATAQDSFHLYSIVWTPQLVNIYTDSTKLLTYFNSGRGPAQWPFDSSCFLLLNIAIGGQWGGQQGVDTSIFPQQMLVDYVRVYQKVD